MWMKKRTVTYSIGRVAVLCLIDIFFAFPLPLQTPINLNVRKYPALMFGNKEHHKHLSAQRLYDTS